MYLIDGRPDDCIDVRDRGLQYGDGVFETIAVRNGQPRFWPRHMQRLAAACERLAIAVPDPNILHAEARQVCGDSPEGVLKLIVTRGSGGRGYRPDPEALPRRIVSHHPLPAYPWDPANGVRIRLCRTRLARNPALAGMKHLNRLEQVLARGEWDDPAVAEGVMRDTDGNVIDGTMSNIFMVKGDELFTPDVSYSGVAGIVRAWVAEQAGQIGLRLREQQLTPADFDSADEVFLTNSVIGIWPVAYFEGRAYAGFAAARALSARLDEGAS